MNMYWEVVGVNEDGVCYIDDVYAENEMVAEEKFEGSHPDCKVVEVIGPYDDSCPFDWLVEAVKNI